METNQTLMRRVTDLTTTLRKVYLTKAFILIASLLSLSSISQAQNITTTLATRQKCPGDTVWVSVYVQNLVNCSAGSLEFTFNTSALTPTATGQADAPTIAYRNKSSQITGMWLVNAHNDTVTMGFFNLSSPINIASGLICQLLFTVNNNNGYSALNWNLGTDSAACMYSDFNDPFGPALPATWVNGNVHTSPSIMTQPTNLTLTPLGTGSFTVVGVGATTYTWQVSTNGGGLYTDITPGAPYSGESTNTLTITSAPVSMNGYKYRCKVGGSCNSPYNFTNSIAVTLTVSIPCPTAFTVTGGGSYCPGTSGAVVGLSGSESGVFYQLKRNGSPIGSPVAGDGGPITFGPQTIATSPSTFTAEGTNTCGTTQMTGSVPVSLYTLTIGIMNAPNPNPTICSGQGTTLVVQLSGPSGYLPSTLIYKDETNFLYPAIVLTGGNNFPQIFPTATHTYTIYSLVDNHGCYATNISGSATINVNPSPNPTIGSNSPVCQGQDLLLTASASGSVTYSWSHALTGWSSTDQNPVRPNAQANFGGTYNLQVTNTLNLCSRSVTTQVTVNPPLPAVAGSISGPNNVCKGQNGVVYSVGTIANAATYLWNVPAGFDIVSGSGTNSITVNIGANATSDNVTVAGNNGCGTGTASNLLVTAHNLPNVTWTNTLTSQCITSTTFGLTGGTPAGGVYSGAGVTGSNFNASVAGLGSHTLTYSYTDAFGCSGSITNTIFVNSLPPVSWTNTLTPQCVSSNFYLLSGATPAGGTYSGTGVSGGIFNASVAGTGVKTLTYTYTDGNGCTNTATNTITVNPLPSVTWSNALSAQCANSTNYTLTGGNPAGGVYSGVGVTGTNFNASVAGTGIKTLTYTFTDNNSCTNSATNTITVNALPVVTWSDALPAQCISSTTFVLSGGSPSGGTYSGPGVSGNNFNASIAGTGLKTITYAFTNNGCTASVTNTILVYGLPLANAGADQNLNSGQSTTLFGSATGGTGNFTYNWSPAGSLVNPNVQNPLTITLTSTTVFTLVVTDNISGCQSLGDQVTINVSNFPLTLNVIATPNNVCAGGTSTLSAGASGGTGPYTYAWSSAGGFTSVLPNPIVNPLVTTTYFVTVSDDLGSQTGSVTINVTALPEIFTIGGGGSECEGGNGLEITLSGSQEGYNYILNYNGVFLTSQIGNGLALAFGPFAEGGNYTITASVPSLGCMSFMSGIANIVINPKPTVFNGIIGATICDQNGAVPISLSGSQIGVNYQLYLDGNPVNAPVEGTGSSILLANATATGIYSAIGVNAITGCSSDMNLDNWVNFYPSPQVFNVSGGGTFCAEGSANIILDGSEYGVQYRLLLNGVLTLYIQNGSGQSLTFGTITVPGTYTVQATNTNSGCVVLMNSQAYIISYDIPVANAGPDQNIPYGTTTVLNGSATGNSGDIYTYHWEPISLLVNADVQNPTTVNLTSTSFFTLVVTNLTTGCISQANEVMVGVTGGPLAITVSAEPTTICAGGSATLNVQIQDGSGVYNISWTSDPAGFTSTLASPVVNPSETTTYFVEVNDGVNTLNGEVTITVNQLPIVYTVSGGGAACAGSEGFMILIPSSQPGAAYSVYLDGDLFAGPFVGTGEFMEFGLYNTAGTYTIGATMNGCSTMMDGNAVITINAVPVVVTNPVDLSLPEGGSGHFIVNASFANTYNWEMSTDGIIWTAVMDDANYSGANTNQLNIADVTLAMSGTYYHCLLSNATCSNVSGTAMLTVYPFVAEITATLGNHTVCPGEILIPLHVNNMLDVASISLAFTFDASVLNYINFININPAISDPSLITVNAFSGNLIFSHFSLTPYSIFDGNLVDLVFNYTGGNTDLTWNTSAAENNQFTNLNGDVLNAVFVNGSVNQLSNAPVINTQPSSITVNNGDNAVFSVVASGATNYQWQVYFGGLWNNLNDDATYSGVNTPTLTITGATLAMNNYQYICIVSEDLCNLEVLSNTATLNVNNISAQIITTAGSATACSGSQVIVPVTVNDVLNVSAISLTLGWNPAVLTYVNTQNINPAFVNPGEIIFNSSPGYWAMSWYNVVPINILSGTLLDLVFDYNGGSTALAWNLGVSGACEYDDTDGNVLPATFNNGMINGNAGPAIVSQPANVTIYDGSNASFNVIANNTTGYAWYVSTNNGGSWTALTDGGVYSGTHSSSLQITAANISMNGYLYHSLLTNDNCSINTSNAQLTVLPVVQGINTTAGTVYACTNTQVIVPVYAEYVYNVSAISMVLNYDPSVLTYTGIQNINSVFNPPADGILFNSAPGNWVMSWYNIAPINLSAGNLFELVFNYNGGSTNLEWNLTTQGYCEYDDADGNILASSFFNGFVGPAGNNPVITQQPMDVNISDLDNATFTVSASGATAYQWQESTDNGNTWNDITDGGIYAGATTSMLVLTGVPITMDNYLYRVVVSGGNCSLNSNSALLNVVPLGGIIQTTVGDLTSCPGSQVVVPVTVQYLYNIAALSLTMNYDPAVLTYVGSQNANPLFAGGSLTEFTSVGQWRMSWFSITPISIGTGTLIDLVFNYNGGTTDLTWNVLTPGFCEYNDFDGNILLANFNNGSVGPNGSTPTITSSPVDVTVAHHGNAIFSVSATNATAYQWQISTDGGNNWSDLSNNSVYSGVTTTELNITDAIYLYNGYQYRCIVTGNICAVASEAATLTVTPIAFNIVTTATTSTNCPGSFVVVPITVTDFYNVASISLVVNYDESVLQYTGYQNVNSGLADALLNPSTGEFALSWYSVNPLSLGDATLFELVFHYNGGVGNLNWDLATTGNCEYTNIEGNVMSATFVDGTVTSSEVIPVIVSNPVETGGFVGDPATFTASVSNAVSVQWQFSNDGGLTWNNVIDDGNVTGSTTEVLSIAHLQLDMNGNLYRLFTYGTCGHDAFTESALLTVILQPTIITTAGSAEQCAGDVIIPISAVNFMNVSAMSLTLNFDNTQFDFVNYQNVDPAFSNGVISINNMGGQILVGYFSIIPTTIADGVLFELVFHSTGGTTALNWDVVTPGACEYQTIQSYIIPSAFVDGSIMIHALPDVSVGPFASVCIDGNPVELFGTPQGGEFSGTGVVDGLFYPNLTGAGTYSILYSYTDEFGCSNTAQTSITVNALPEVSVGPFAPVCVNGNPVILIGYPEGGTFGGTGVVEGVFYPEQAGVGTFSIVYTYTDESGCTNTAESFITVNELPTASLSLPAEVCAGDIFNGVITISGGVGPWTVVLNDGVNPDYSVTVNESPYDFALSLTQTTTYTLVSVTDANGCTNILNQAVTVTAYPVTSIVSSPADVAMDEGGNAYFSVVALNATSYQWQISTDNGSNWINLIDDATYAGVNTADLTVYAVNYFMGGNQFRCIVSGTCPASSTSGTATLTVYPVITTIAGTVEQCAGDILVPINVLHMYGMAAMSLSLNYDNTVLTYAGFQDVHPDFSNGFLAIDAINGQVKMGYFTITPANFGDALMFNIIFTSTGGYSALTWDTQTVGNCEYQNLAGGNITSIYINGSVTVNPLPTLTASVDPSYICSGSSSTITYNLTGTAPWTLVVTEDSGNGVPTTSTVVANATPFVVTVSPVVTTTYTVVSLTDFNGCGSTNFAPVTVNVYEPLTAEITIDDNEICVGESVTINVNFTTGVAPYTFFINNNGVPEHYVVMGNTWSHTYTPSINTTYTLVSILDGNNCFNLIGTSVSVTVNPLPVVTLNPIPNMCIDAAPYALIGSPISGDYSGPGVNGNMFYPSIAGVGTWTITHTYTNALGCTNSASQTVTVYALPVVYTLFGGGQYCAGGNGLVIGLGGSEIGIQYQLYRDAVYTGQMIMGNGSVINFGTQLAAGTYTVLATNLVTGCNVWMDGTPSVVINPLPNAYAGGYSIMCQGTSTTINAVVTGGVGPYNYQWSPATGLNNPTILNPIASPSGTTFYTLLVTDMNGCTDSDNALIVVNPKPIVNAGVDKTIVLGGSVVMTSTVSGGLAPYTYSWTPATGLSNPNVLNPIASPIVTTTYTLQVTDARGCVGTDVVVINVTNVPFGYDISGFVTYDNLVATPLNNTTVTLQQGATVINSTVTTANGEYVLSPVANGTYTTHGSSSKPWNGGNALDALLISRHFTGEQPLAGLRLLAGDVNGDGILNAVDALLVMRRSVLLITSFPAGDWIFETKTVTVNNGNVINNFMGLCYGDVNGSNIPSAKLLPSVMLEIQGTQSILTNEEFNLPIQAGRNMNVGAVSLVLDIPAGLDIIGVQPVDKLKSSNFLYNIIDGKLYIEWYTLNNLEVNKGETLFTMTVSTNKFADTKEFVFNIDGSSVMGDQNASVIESALITMPKVKIVEGAFALGNNFPNPFSQSTDISYTLPEAGKVTLVIYNAMGEVIAEVVNEVQNAGNYVVTFDGTKQSQGVYFYRMVVNGTKRNYEAVNRMLISR